MSDSPLSPLLTMDRNALRCPYPVYEQVRNESRAYWSEELGQFVVSGYDDIMFVLRHPDLFSSERVTEAGLKGAMAAIAAAEPSRLDAQRQASAPQRPDPVLIRADPPLHTRHRNFVARAFGIRRVTSMEPAIRQITNDLVDAFIEDGHVELVDQFAVLLPLTVIADALGVDRDDLPTFKRWSDDLLGILGSTEVTMDQIAAVGRAQAEFNEYTAKRIEDRRREPREDMISDVVHASIDGEGLSTDVMLDMFLQFLVAGNETTTKLITSGMLLLLQHPDVLAAVRDDRKLIPNMLEETLRVESPIQGLFRVATVDTKVGDVDIPAGSELWLLYAAANRDPDHFSMPDDYDIARPNAKTHLAFAQGPHFCIGAALARAEARIAFETLLDRLDTIRLDTERNTFEYEPSYVMHGLKALHLQFTPSTAATTERTR